MKSMGFVSSLTFIPAFGEVQEWLNWQHWKCCERETVPWVRIPPSPPYKLPIGDCRLTIGLVTKQLRTSYILIFLNYDSVLWSRL